MIRHGKQLASAEEDARWTLFEQGDWEGYLKLRADQWGTTASSRLVKQPVKPQVPPATIEPKSEIRSVTTQEPSKGPPRVTARAARQREAQDLKIKYRQQMGRGPWPCFWCQGEVVGSGLTIHHFDGNHENNDVRNLRATHKNCHWANHDAEERGAQRGTSADVESFVA